VVTGLAPTDAERISALEKKIDDLSKKTAAKPAGDKKPDGVWEDMSTDKWTVKLGGHVQTDYINWAQADEPPIPAQNYFEFRRLRLTADGTGYGVYDFRLQMTLEPPTIGTTVNPVPVLGTPIGTPLVKDAYFSINEIPLIGRWRIGNFFVPFGLEQVTNDTFNVFLERSIPTENIFTASRQVGMATYNCTDDKNITWSTGLFFDSGGDVEFQKKRINDNQGVRASGRVTWLPYYDEPSNGRYLVHTGAGVLYTKDQDQIVRFAARPQIHEGPRLIDSGNILADEYTTGNLEFAAVMGPVTIQSEAYISNVNRLTGSNVAVGGAYLHASYFLTGENRIYERFGQHGAQFGRNAPYSNVFFVPGAFSLGAWELKARWSYLDLDPLNRGQYNDFTFGFNWYWSDRTRMMFDWIHPMTTSQTTFGAHNSDILAMRWDFNW
jgi:phosphate-selective porin OprO/OprP